MAVVAEALDVLLRRKLNSRADLDCCITMWRAIAAQEPGFVHCSFHVETHRNEARAVGGCGCSAMHKTQQEWDHQPVPNEPVPSFSKRVILDGSFTPARFCA